MPSASALNRAAPNWGPAGAGSAKITWLDRGATDPVGEPRNGQVQMVTSFVSGDGPLRCVGSRAASVALVPQDIYGEFDPGSGRTLAACLTHASRTVKRELAPVDQWRTGE